AEPRRAQDAGDGEEGDHPLATGVRRHAGRPSGPSELEDGDRPDPFGLLGVLGEPGVAAGLFGVDAVPGLAGDLTDRHPIGVGATLHGAVTGGDEVVVPVRVGGCPGLGGEDVDDVGSCRVGPWGTGPGSCGGVVGGEVHHRGDVLLTALAASVMDQHHRRTFETPAHPAVVGPELGDDLVVPVLRFRHLTLRLDGGTTVVTPVVDWAPCRRDATSTPSRPAPVATRTAGSAACTPRSPSGPPASPWPPCPTPDGSSTWAAARATSSGRSPRAGRPSSGWTASTRRRRWWRSPRRPPPQDACTVAPGWSRICRTPTAPSTWWCPPPRSTTGRISGQASASAPGSSDPEGPWCWWTNSRRGWPPP